MERTPNDDRSDTKNRNNPAYKADRTNRNKQRKSNNRKTGNNKSGKK
ncbi:MAG: hypothetical protein OXF45_00395 [Candidatus Dadabacteria bacterium]|nr:hypothetical protein [Candidatus Dadabacteria bacterium]